MGQVIQEMPWQSQGLDPSLLRADIADPLAPAVRIPDHVSGRRIRQLVACASSPSLARPSDAGEITLNRRGVSS